MPLARLLLLASALTLSACGFHPAGRQPLPDALRSVHVELVDPYRVAAPPVEDALKARIIRQGGVVRESAAEAGVQLRLSALQEAQEVLSIGNDGRANEFRLVARVTFEVLRVVDGKAEVLVAPATQTVSREFSFSAQQILAKEAEEQRLRRFLHDDLADRVLRRIAAGLRAGASGPATAAGAALPG